MTINNLKPALELWDNGFNIIRINSNFYPPTPENPAKDFRNFKTPLGKWQQYQNKRETREVGKKWYEDRPYLNLEDFHDVRSSPFSKAGIQKAT